MFNDSYLRPDWRTPDERPIRDGVGEGLLRVGDDERVIVLTADLGGSTRVKVFQDVYPDRYFDVGVAEQNMAGVAAGLALEGYKPYMSSYATFSPGRNWEQIRVSIALTAVNVNIIGSHGGVASGIYGPTHQGTEDIALMRTLPNMTVLVPADATQLSAAIVAAHEHMGPVYIRTARPPMPDFTRDIPFKIGKAYVLREVTTTSKRMVTLLATGATVYEALVASEQLSRDGVECEVLNVSTVKPLDSYTIEQSARRTGRVVTVEDHQVVGGLGSAVAEALADAYPVPVKRIGVPDRFGVSGPWRDVYREMGLDRQSIATAVRDFVR